MKQSFGMIGGLWLIPLILGCDSSQNVAPIAKPEASPPAQTSPAATVESVPAPVEPKPVQPAPALPTVTEAQPKVETPVAPAASPLPANVTVIDLAPYQQPLQELIGKSIATFTAKHPDTEVSLLVVSYSGLNPTVMIAVDTPAHSAAHVKKYPDSSGNDEHGNFCKSPYDCQFQLAEDRFKGFPDLYKVTEIALKMPNGKVLPVDQENGGDEAINAVMFQFLVPLVEQSTAYRSLKRAPVFRTGVVMQNSKLSKFWVPAK